MFKLKTPLFLKSRSGDVLIAVSGEYGTLSEISIALKDKKKVIALWPSYHFHGLDIVGSPQEAVKKALY
ncbi:MAG: hypothetical protein C4554_09915 [Dethiobacter sp.]|jgi:predicted Rossmann-fold nucleotide-binding protein|nr:MAG: hypothetical protein C4554_09915 [Dethiobacter sp.]